MAKLVVEEQKEIPTLPDDSILHLKVEEIELKTVQGNRGPWDKLDFKFKILGVLHVEGAYSPEEFGNLLGENIYGGMGARMTDSPENRLRLWAEAILQRELPVGFELDTDYLLGREVRGVVRTYEKRNINPATGQPFRGHNVQSLLPLGGGVSGPAPGDAAPQPAPQNWGAGPAEQSGWGAPQQAPQQGGWGAPPQQAPQQAPPQQAPVADPWATPGVAAPGGYDEEPPF